MCIKWEKLNPNKQFNQLATTFLNLVPLHTQFNAFLCFKINISLVYIFVAVLKFEMQVCNCIL